MICGSNGPIVCREDQSFQDETVVVQRYDMDRPAIH